MAMENEPVIEMGNVSFGYGGAGVLENVSFSVKKGEIASIVGPNGGGKTTLLKLILGLLHPEKGSVKVFGTAPERARGRMGYMPQHINYDSFFPATVLDVVLMGRVERHFAGMYRKEDRESARAALREVGLEELAGRHFARLSGGQRQRVVIARAIVSEPELLLLDEPTANVDLVSEHKLHDILNKLNLNMTILMVSHDLGFVSDLVKNVICVNRRVVVHPTSEISGEIIEELYDMPLRFVHHDYHLAHECPEALCRPGGGKQERREVPDA